jgi:hypothetical protein
MLRVLQLAQTFLAHRRKDRMHGPAALTGAILLMLGLAGCSSDSSDSQTQTVTGSISGAAASDLINSNSQGPFTFPSLVFTGPVTTSAANETISTSTAQTIQTLAGNFAVSLRLRNQPRTQRTWTGEHGGMCTFTQDARTGNYVVEGSQSTGKFAGATGNGSYAITIRGAAPLLAAKTTCSTPNTGDVVPQGASINLRAVGPLALKSS